MTANQLLLHIVEYLLTCPAAITNRTHVIQGECAEIVRPGFGNVGKARHIRLRAFHRQNACCRHEWLHRSIWDQDFTLLKMSPLRQGQ